METNKNQTAVSWLEQELFRRYNFIDDEFIFHQAKQMEREQIEEAFLECNCRFSGIEVGTIEDINEAKEYYEEKYGK